LVDSYSFTDEKYVKLPIRFIEVISGSTGLAAGNTIEEALIQGVCEVFERYAAYKILVDKVECSTISLNSIKNSKIHDYVNLFKSMNIDVKIKDFSLGRNLPVIGVIFTNNNIENDENELKKDLYYKMIDVGSHPDLNQAILRCFIERLQGVTKEEFIFRRNCDVLYTFWTEQLGKNYIKTDEILKDFFINYEMCGDISFLDSGKEILFNELKSIENTDCLNDCNSLIETCKNNDWDLQVIDYTHKTIEFPALRVIIPPLSTSHDPYKELNRC
jgi:YcaO-like protein with predicted kinase domain